MRSESVSGEEVEISGTVESVVFHNDETGYTVCSVSPVNARRVRGQKESFTMVGTCTSIWEGEELRAAGEWVRHPQHGLQFQAKNIVCITPTSTEGLKRYLASGLIRGIGPKYAERIVETFGAETIEILDKHSARLEEVPGIGEERRRRIRESWTEQRGIREIMIFLQAHGIGTAKASRIYRRYGADSIAVVKRNPYRLCNDVWGIGFKSADAIALSVGVPRDSEVRARAGLVYTLESQAEEEGHCFCIDADLLLHAQELLGISVERLEAALKAEMEEGRLFKDGNRVYLKDLYYSEVRVARKVRALMETAARFAPIPAERAIAWAEQKMGLKLAASQLEAVANALRSKFSIITGGPGVGKTTIIRALTEIFGVRRLEVVLAAPTGRAAKRMSESTGRGAQTIHRLLKYNPQENRFMHDAENPMAGDVFIVDETSMIDLRLADRFLQAVRDTAVVVFVGDIDQLPSVGPGNVLRDMISSGVVPTVKLDVIFRQDNSGLIVKNAHLVNAGERFETRAGESDFYFVETDDPAEIVRRTILLMTRRIPDKFRMDPFCDVQVLTPMRKNLLGCDSLNEAIQRAINPAGPSLVRGAVRFRERDRVMQLRNNYDKEVFNGDIGFVKQVDEEEGRMVVLFDGRPVAYRRGELDELQLAYACSIHKSQGSEYPAAIVLLHTQHFKLLQRNLLYTAITRGKRLVMVVGTSKAVGIAVRNNQVRERRTALQERLREGEAS